MKVLVTGGLGFIGSHLVEALLDKGYEVSIYDRGINVENLKEVSLHPRWSQASLTIGDVRDYDSLVKALKEVSIIYHLAALTSHRLSISDPYSYIAVNMMGTENVLEAARKAEPTPKVVFTSSASIYGKQKSPVSEDMQPKPDGPYALSKVFGEELCKIYHRLYGLPFIILRYFNVVGERARKDIVLTIFADRIRRGLPPIVHGERDLQTGRFTPAMRDFTYVEDIVEGTIIASDNKEAVGEVFNLGTSQPRSVLELALLLIKRLEGGKQSLRPILAELGKHEALINYSDNSKAQRVLGWKPRFKLEEIVERYCSWLGAHR